MKRILLPTDFTTSSNEVISFALEAFNDERCEFFFIHSYIFNVHGLDALSLLHDADVLFEKADAEVVEKMANQVGYFANKHNYSKHKFKLLCKNSDFLEAVEEAVEKFDIDIVIVGTKGKKVNRDCYLERKINQLMTTIKSCPVMAIPLNENAWYCIGIDEIILAS